MTSLSTELKHVMTSSTCYQMWFLNTSEFFFFTSHKGVLSIITSGGVTFIKDQGLNPHYAWFSNTNCILFWFIQDERWHRSSYSLSIYWHHQMWDHSILRQHHQHMHIAVMYCVQPKGTKIILHAIIPQRSFLFSALIEALVNSKINKNIFMCA